MFLSRITITGFKSFANKTVINLETGMTAVVGPNGSGKSNLADAIRWALGEQGKNRLRLGDREEVVFAGTSTRPKASFAEVTLLFNNEDGSFGLDLTEVEISRRMYRSGETDYRLAGRSVRLADIQALLAQAGVGAGSYAVIGQGMIDSMLLSSPSERKLLFDEASGIRGPELGREAALRKLNATATNLTRLRDIAAELEPRAGSLQVAMAAADERSQLEGEIEQLRRSIVAAECGHWSEAEKRAAQQLAGLEGREHQLRHEQHDLEQARRRAERATTAAEEKRRRLQSELGELELARDQAVNALAAAQAAVAESEKAADATSQRTLELGRLAVEATAADHRLQELQSQVASNAEAAARAAKAVERAGREVAAAQAALVALRKGAAESTRDQYLDHALQILKALASGLGKPEYTQEHIRLLIHKAGRLLSHATRGAAEELLEELKRSQKQLETAMNKRETAVEHQTNVSITSRSLEIDVAHQSAEVERVAGLHARIETEIAGLEPAAAPLAERRGAEKSATAALRSATRKLEDARSRLAELSHSTGQSAAADQLARLATVKAELGALNDRLSAARAELATAQAELARATRQAVDWGVPVKHSTSTRPLPILLDQLARSEARLQALREQYDQQLGEYQEVTHRQSELSTQIADLEAAEADLNQLVSNLEALIRSRFRENFQALATQFSNYFSRLFDGGSASLELTETEGEGYGIVIKASPAGKRLASIAALSGGERALAGVALVAAILKVNPSPFVVLDEIDAALDESNSGRLAGILTELQQTSQLIVITHNRQTMKAAQVLFGVTLGEHHISSLISMRLEQATQLAAR